MCATTNFIPRIEYVIYFWEVRVDE